MASEIWIRMIAVHIIGATARAEAMMAEGQAAKAIGTTTGPTAARDRRKATDLGVTMPIDTGAHSAITSVVTIRTEKVPLLNKIS